MSPAVESRITECPQYLRVDFGSCDYFELSETYRSFVDLCLGTQVNSALLHAGDNEPGGHRQLRELLSARGGGMARGAGGVRTDGVVAGHQAAMAACEADSRLTTP
jgi:hypothetical protein